MSELLSPVIEAAVFWMYVQAWLQLINGIIGPVLGISALIGIMIALWKFVTFIEKNSRT